MDQKMKKKKIVGPERDAGKAAVDVTRYAKKESLDRGPWISLTYHLNLQAKDQGPTQVCPGPARPNLGTHRECSTQNGHQKKVSPKQGQYFFSIG